MHTHTDATKHAFAGDECGHCHCPDLTAADLVDALILDIVDNGAYNALGTGLVDRLIEIKEAL